MSEGFDPSDYSFVVKRRGSPAKPWRWEIYRAGRSGLVECSPGFFESMAEAAKEGPLDASWPNRPRETHKLRRMNKRRRISYGCLYDRLRAPRRGGLRGRHNQSDQGSPFGRLVA